MLKTWSSNIAPSNAKLTMDENDRNNGSESALESAHAHHSNQQSDNIVGESLSNRFEDLSLIPEWLKQSRQPFRQSNSPNSPSQEPALYPTSPSARSRTVVQPLRTGPDAGRDETVSSASRQSPEQPSLPVYSVNWSLIYPQLIELFLRSHVNSWDRSNLGWLSSAYEASNDRYPLLQLMFTATGLSYVGQRDKDITLEREGSKRYNLCLKTLQQKIDSAGHSDEEEVLYVTTLAAMYEMLVFGNAKACTIHLLGAEQVLQHRGAERHAFGLEFLTMKFLRIFLVCLHISLRQDLFLATTEWKSRPWQISRHSKGPQDLLLDDLSEIPGIFATADELKGKTDASSNGATQTSELNSFNTRVSNFESDLVSSYQNFGMVAKGRVPSGSFSTTQYQITESFPRLEAAFATNLFNTSRLLISTVDLRQQRLLDTQKRMLIEGICAAAQFQLGSSSCDYSMALMLLFPLCVAYCEAGENNEQRRNVMEIIRVIHVVFKVKVAACLIETLPNIIDGPSVS